MHLPPDLALFPGSCGHTQEPGNEAKRLSEN